MADQEQTTKPSEPVKASEPVQSTKSTAPAGQTQSSGTPTNSGSNKTLVIVVVVIVILAILGLIGGRILSNYLAKRAGEKVAESLLGGALGGKVDVSNGGDSVNVSTKDGTISTGNSAKWPSDMPSSVPKFNYGDITFSAKTTNNGNAWSVLFEKVSDQAMEKYKTDLTNAGWTDETQTSLGIVNTLQVTKGNLNLSIAFDPQSKGATMTVSEKAQ